MSARAEAAGTFVALVAAVLLLVVFWPATAAVRQNRADVAERRDLVLVNRNAIVDAPIAGDAQILGGVVELNASIAGDVVALGSQLRLGPEARIDGNLVAFGGTLEGLDRSRVGGEVWAPGGSATLFGDHGSGEALIGMISEPFSLAAVAIKLSLTLFWILISLPIVLLAGREVRTGSLEVRAGPGYSFLLGLVGFTSFVLTAIAFSYLIPVGIGLFLLALLGALAVAVKVFGMVAVFHAVGSMIAGPKTRGDLAKGRVRGDLALTLLGAVVIGALRLVPVVGNLVWVAVSIVGVGVALASGFGRREPWFLTYRADARSS